MPQLSAVTIVPLHCTVNTYGETSEQKPQQAAAPATSTPILFNKTLLRAGPMGPHALKRPPLVHKKGRVQQAPLQGALWPSIPNGALIRGPKELLDNTPVSLWLTGHPCYFFSRDCMTLSYQNSTDKLIWVESNPSQRLKKFGLGFHTCWKWPFVTANLC